MIIISDLTMLAASAKRAGRVEELATLSDLQKTCVEDPHAADMALVLSKWLAAELKQPFHLSTRDEMQFALLALADL